MAPAGDVRGGAGDTVKLEPFHTTELKRA